MNALRFALAIAFSRDRRALWRQASLIVGAMIAVITALLTIALPLAAEEAYRHGMDRAPLYTGATAEGGVGSSRDGATIEIVSRGTLVDGAQVSTVWIRPADGHEDDPGVIPPGLDALPAPGEAVLSQGLVRSGVTAEDLGWASSDAGSAANGGIGVDGLMTSSEPLIYVRPTVDRTLGEGGAVYYATGFGPEQAEGAPAFAPDPEILAPRSMSLGALGAIAVPGLVVLIASARARSGVRDQRLALMTALGVRESVARGVLAIEAGSLAVVGAVLGAAGYQAVLSGAAVSIPATSIRLLPGSLGVTWPAIALAVAAVVVIAAAVSASGRVIARHRRHTPRPPHAIWAVLLGLSLAAIVVSGTPLNPAAMVAPTPEQAGTWVFVIATLVALVATPLAIPVLCRGVAGLLRKSALPTIWAASHRLRHHATHLARIPAILGLLIVLSSTATAIWGASVLAQQEGGDGGPATTVDVSWRDPAPQDIGQIQAALDDAGLPVIALPTVTQDDSEGPVQDKVLVPDCTAFVTLFSGDPEEYCRDEVSDQLGSFVRDHVGAELTAGAVDLRDGSSAVRLVSTQHIDVGEIQRELAWLPGLNIDLRPGDVTAPYPTAQWAIAAGLTSMAILGLAVIREIGDVSMEDRERDETYLRLGLSARTVDRLGWAIMLVPLSVSLVASVVISVVIAYSGELSGITHGDTLRLLIVAVVAFVLTCAACATTIIARHASREGRPR